MKTATISPLRLFLTGLYLLLWPALVLLVAGDWSWLEGWVFGGWFVAVCASVTIWLYRKDPALLLERYRRPGTGGQNRTDATIVYLLLAGFLAWMALMPLDARRFHWTMPMPIGAEIAGGAMLLLSWFFLFRSFTDNTFLSPLVRLQRERQHRVVSTGVYGFVRHPMYLGAMLMFIGAPLLLGALTAVVAGIALSLLLAVRTIEEEALLAKELEGYEAYRKRVPYRMLPPIW